MNSRQKIPVAVTIAGSDSGGGAGIQADLKTFARIGVHGTSAITCVTAQNPKGVLGIQSVKAEMVTKQLEAIFAEFQPCAAKTGMLFSTEIIRAVAKFFQAHRHVPLVIDPVMIATSGARLLKPSAVDAMEKELLPLATLVTPNLAEAEVLVRREISTLKEMQSAAKEIFERFGCATLVKGGHRQSGGKAADVFFDGKTEIILRSEFITGISTHGTGCTFSAAIAASLAQGDDLQASVRRAKKFITRAIRKSVRVSSHSVLGNF